MSKQINGETKRIAVELSDQDWKRIQRERKRLEKEGRLNNSVSFVIRKLIRTHLN